MTCPPSTYTCRALLSVRARQASSSVRITVTRSSSACRLVEGEVGDVGQARGVYRPWCAENDSPDGALALGEREAGELTDVEGAVRTQVRRIGTGSIGIFDPGGWLRNGGAGTSRSGKTAGVEVRACSTFTRWFPPAPATT